jgi:predicted nuclease of predicted toxin-antitoxin system
MKFIVDAQLPKSLSDLLKYRGFDSIHTLDLPNKNSTSDKEITEIAINEKRIVITKDNDFLESFLLNSKPEKLIVVRTGNIPNPILLKIFDNNLELIKSMISRSNLIEITRNEIAEHE